MNEPKKTQTTKTPFFNEGEMVCAKQWPERRLWVRRFVDRIYYCRDIAGNTTLDLIYFERELKRC